MAEAAGQVVVDRPGGLEVSIDDCGSQKFKAPQLYILGDGVGKRSGGRDLVKFLEVIYHLLTIHESPDLI